MRCRSKLLRLTQTSQPNPNPSFPGAVSARAGRKVRQAYNKGRAASAGVQRGREGLRQDDEAGKRGCEIEKENGNPEKGKLGWESHTPLYFIHPTDKIEFSG